MSGLTVTKVLCGFAIRCMGLLGRAGSLKSQFYHWDLFPGGMILLSRPLGPYGPRAKEIFARICLLAWTISGRFVHSSHANFASKLTQFMS